MFDPPLKPWFICKESDEFSVLIAHAKVGIFASVLNVQQLRLLHRLGKACSHVTAIIYCVIKASENRRKFWLDA